VLIGLLLFEFLDFPTFLIANVIVDLEPFLVILLGLDYPLHGFFHSFVGGTIVAVAFAVVMFKSSNIIGKVMKFFRLDQKVTWKSIIAASLLGVYVHILLDTPLYPDIRPFYPLDLNPYFFSDMSIAISIYMFCIFSFLAGSIVYVVKLALQVRAHPKQ
jgi:hypothetical protein